MKVSFLVTFYNQQDYVQQALDSILAIDKPFEWEIRVGDDGSSDGTVDIVNTYIRAYPDHIFLHVMPRDQRKKYNAVRRLGANKLNLLKHATGDFFCNLDGDDRYCDKGFVAEALDIFEKNSALSVVAFGYKTVVGGVDSGYYTLPVEGIISTRDYLQSMYTHVGACVLRLVRDQKRIDGISDLGYYDDNTIVANNLYYGKLYAVPRAVYAYRQTSNSIMTSMSKVDEMVHNCQGCDIDIKLVREENRPDVLQRYAYAIIGMYLRRGKLHTQLKETRYEMYLSECRIIPDSLAYKLLSWNQLDQKSKRGTKKIVLPLLQTNWKFTIKMIIKMLVDK